VNKKQECKKELQPGVQKHDIVDFIFHLQIKAERANNQDRHNGIEKKRRALFLTPSLAQKIKSLADHVCAVRLSQNVINQAIDESQKSVKGKWYPKLSLTNLSGPANDQTMYEAIENEALKHFASPELDKYINEWDLKQLQTKRAYAVILKNIRATRSLTKISDYLSSMGFDISKIEPREYEKAEKQPAPKFSKDVLFPCVKD